MNVKNMWYGAAYYPEHWPEERWATDARLMREAGLNVVRLGEFAWAKMEPEENRFDFDWLDRVIGILQKEGISVLLGTPTAGPPAWLVNADDPARDCRQVYEGGLRWQFGGRSMCCVNHPRFIERSGRIAGALGEHFARHPAVMGFQIDNEVGMYGTRCYCDICHQKFRDWMRRKYGSIKAVNERLGTIFGGGLFRDFPHIPIPRIGQDLHNPGLILDSQRFFSESNAAYLRLQAEALRATGVRTPITTNVCHMASGWSGFDENALFQSLDVAGWDCYPQQFAVNPEPATMGLLHTMARAYKQKSYWMLEQQSGGPFGMAADDTRRIRLWTWQSIAHGAAMILYFRWRTCRFGGEQYWRGILDHDGRLNARYEIIARTGAEIRRLEANLSGITRRRDAAILMDFDTCQSFHLNHANSRIKYRNQAEACFAALQRLGCGADVVFKPPDPGRYRLLVAPALRIMDPDWAERLRRFVEQGGILVATICTASLNRDHVVPAEPVPWKLTDLFGVHRVEWSNLSGVAAPPKERLGEDASAWKHLQRAGTVPVVAADGPLAGQYAADTWCDHLEVEGAEVEVLARFAAGSPAGGAPAVTCHRFGSGRAVYVAASMEAKLNERLMEWLLGRLAAAPRAESDRVEIVPAEQNSRRLYFILNHGAAAARVTLPPGARDLSNDVSLGSELVLESYDIRIVACG